jgi:hypothetical protein
MPSKPHSIAKPKCWTEAELLDMPVEVLDRLAFGVSSGGCIEISPKEITMIYPGDLDNPRHCYAQGSNAWRHAVSFDEPVEISIDSERRKNLVNVHHRYFAALLLGRKLKAIVEITGNPILALLARQASKANTNSYVLSLGGL